MLRAVQSMLLLLSQPVVLSHRADQAKYHICGISRSLPPDHYQWCRRFDVIQCIVKKNMRESDPVVPMCPLRGISDTGKQMPTAETAITIEEVDESRPHQYHLQHHAAGRLQPMDTCPSGEVAVHMLKSITKSPFYQ